MEFKNYQEKLKHNQNLQLFLRTNKEIAITKTRLRIKEEANLQNKLINMSIRPAVKGYEGVIEKRILPFFSVPVMLKKVSDKKKNKNYNSIIPQKKLFYKVEIMNKKLNKLVNSIHKYNLNLNSFKGNKLDFILFLRENLYFNLKIRLSNISYKINLIKLIYSTLINNNKNSIVTESLSSPLAIKIIEIEKKKRENLSIKFLDNIEKILSNNHLKLKLYDTESFNKFFYSKNKTISNNKINSLFVLFALNSKQEELEYNIINSKYNEFNYLLFKLNSLLKKFKSLINIIKINKEMSINPEMMILENKNSTSSEGRIASLKKVDNSINSNNMIVDSFFTKTSTSVAAATQASNNTSLQTKRKEINNKNLYLQILQNNSKNNDYDSSWQLIDERNKELIPSLKDKGIFSKQFNRKTDTISLNSNPVNVLYFNDNKNKPMINQYLKAMTMYNLSRKGSFMFFTNIIGYKFYNKNFRPFWGYTGSSESSNIYKLIYSSFRSMYCLISKPVFIIKSNKIIIQLFYYLLAPRIFKYKKKYSAFKKRKGYISFKNKFNKKLIKKFMRKKTLKKKKQLIKLDRINLINLYPLKFKKLCEILNNFFKKSVELDLIRLHYPYKESNILVRLLAFMINKIKIRQITRKLLKRVVIKNIKNNYELKNSTKTNIIPAFLSGLTIKIAGRIMKYKIIPRKTVKILRRGSSSVGKINYKNFSRYTNKNKRGAFSISINTGQNFF